MVMKVVAAAVLVYILIRSGDVELNPGPGLYDGEYGHVVERVCEEGKGE